MAIVSDMIKQIQQLLIDGTQVPPERVFVEKPSPAMIGDGPIICIYKAGGNRIPQRAGGGWCLESLKTVHFAVAILVEDLYNKPTDVKTVGILESIVEEVCDTLYQDPVNKAELFLESLPSNSVLSSYKPGADIARVEMVSEASGRLMIGEQLILEITYSENWAAVTVDVDFKAVTGKIKTETTERGLDFEVK